jgi:hypothetical protein
MGETVRIEPRDDGTLYEVFVHRPASVHLEQMSNQHWWLGITLEDGRRVVVNLCAKTQRIFGNVGIDG